MSEENEKVYSSPPSNPDDTFWLEQGRKMIEKSPEAVVEAAKSLMTGTGLVSSIYLGILGFADYIPETLSVPAKSLFVLPLLIWLAGIYYCMQVLMTKRSDIYLFSPDDIAKKYNQILIEKQTKLRFAFWTLAAGMVLVLVLLVWRFNM